MIARPVLYPDGGATKALDTFPVNKIQIYHLLELFKNSNEWRPASQSVELSICVLPKNMPDLQPILSKCSSVKEPKTNDKADQSSEVLVKVWMGGVKFKGKHKRNTVILSQ